MMSEDIDESNKSPKNQPYPFMQNRELSWLSFNERVLDQGTDATVPILDRLSFVSIFSSNLQEFFMIRVGSLTDLSLVKKRIVDNKTLMTPTQQLDAIYERCHELYPIQEKIFADGKSKLGHEGVHQLEVSDLNDEQTQYLRTYLSNNVLPFLSPQIVNLLHPFPHLENGDLYIVVRLEDGSLVVREEKETPETGEEKPEKKGKKAKNLGAQDATLGIIPLPRHYERIISLPGDGFNFILVEHAIEMIVDEVFSMYTVKQTNTICITRNADLDASEGIDENDEDYRDHMKRILKKRSRLAPVRLESKYPLSDDVSAFLRKKLDLKPHQCFVTSVPLDMSYVFDIGSHLDDKKREALSYPSFTPQWPASLSHNKSLIEQVQDTEVLLSYPYESMNPFVQLLREAATDPHVISIKITLYRLANQSHLAEALIAAAENGKEVTALFELRARFDESNNIEWSQRFEQAGAKVLYGFRDYKVHSKICCITRQTDEGIQYITQLGTGNYNEKTATLYTDFAYITTNERFGRDAVTYFKNMGLENISDDYSVLSVAPLQIKPAMLSGIDAEIEKAQRGEPSGIFFKTNSITDKEIIIKLSEASQAGVPITLFVRGICCIVPGIKGYTENVRVVSIVGRLLEHSRIFCFGAFDEMRIYLSSADLMTRNMERRVEIAWPVLNDSLSEEIRSYIKTMMKDTAKLRELKPDLSYTPLGYFAADDTGDELSRFDGQNYLIKHAHERRIAAAHEEIARLANQAGETSGEASDKNSEPLEVKAYTDNALSAPPTKETSRKPSLLARILAFFRGK
ncbi:MAG: polyphosphate kinase 1 [Raoultibacter sp.]|jgi:polyphosphate kinase